MFQKDDHVILTVRGTDHGLYEYTGIVLGETHSGYIIVDTGEGTMYVTSAQLRFQELVA